MGLRRIDCELDGPILLEPEAHGDERGFLVETFRQSWWDELDTGISFVQENHSRSRKGTLRGIHFQREPGQAKLVSCPRGRIWDVVVDLRRESESFGRWEAHQLDDERHRQLLVPIGFGHGFCVLSDPADVIYKLSAPFDPDAEASLAWDDPEVGIEWPVGDPILSERDQSAPRLAEIADSLRF